VVVRPPRPIVLVKQGTQRPVAYACRKCGVVAGSPLQYSGVSEAERHRLAASAARRHCAPGACTCGASTLRYRAECAACSSARCAAESRAQQLARFTAARKVPLADYEGEYVNDDDEWFEPVSDLEDDSAQEHAMETDDGVSWLWGCTLDPPPRVDEGDILEFALRFEHEDASDHVDLARLRGGITIINDALSGVRTIRADYGVAVLLHEPEEEA